MVSPFIFLSLSPSLLSLSLSALLTTPMHHAHAIPECTSLLPLSVFLSSQTGSLPSLSQRTIFSLSLFSPVYHKCLSVSVLHCDQMVFFPFLCFLNPSVITSMNTHTKITITKNVLSKERKKKSWSFILRTFTLELTEPVLHCLPQLLNIVALYHHIMNMLF